MNHCPVDPAELWRLWALLDMLALCTCGGLIFLAYRATMAPLLRVATIPFAGVLLVVSLAVVANYLSPFPPTPGVKLLAAFSTPLVLIAAWVVVQIARHR